MLPARPFDNIFAGAVMGAGKVSDSTAENNDGAISISPNMTRMFGQHKLERLDLSL